MFKKNLTVLILGLALSACATQPGQEAKQRYQDWAKETETVKVFFVHKQRTLDELGAFDFDRRFYIYETLDEIANKLWKSPKRTIVKKTKIEEHGEVAILELSDRDLDGQPDMFAFLSEEEGDTQDFGFLFDLNKDGRADYLVFNGGPMFTKELEIYWMNYHWIDSNYDGRIDIKVNNAVALDASKLPQKGLTAWLYDSDFDGYTDKAEYIGVGITRAVEEKEGTLTVNWLLKDISIDVGKDPMGEGLTLLLANINAAIQ
jgi:hypothetical protein